jgi:hypothetical protein
MALPDRDVAAAWVGKAVVDRDGAEIGPCTAVFTDDATELPEWVCAAIDGVTVLIPVVDAAEVGGRVRVAVTRDQAANAPLVGSVRHVSEDEEAALYQHYGIEHSRAASESVLPAGEGTPSPGGVSSEASAGTGQPVAAPDAWSDSLPTQPDLDVVMSQSAKPVSGTQGRRLAVVLGVLAGLGAVLGAVRRMRRLRTQRRPTLMKRRAGITRARPVAMTARPAQAAAAATSLLKTTGRAGWRGARAASGALISTTASAVPVMAAGGRAAAGAARLAAQLAATTGQAAVRRSATVGRTGAVVARRTGSGVAGLAGVASAWVAVVARGGLRLGGAVGSVPEAVSEGSERLQKRWRRMVSKLMMALGFGAGYVLGTRAGRERYEQLMASAVRVAQRPEVQQARDRLKSRRRGEGATGKPQPQPTVPFTAGAPEEAIPDTPSLYAGDTEQHVSRSPSRDIADAAAEGTAERPPHLDGPPTAP